MKKIVKTLALLGVVFTGSAQAAFVDNYDVSNWTIYENNGGSVNVSGAPNSVTLTSSNAFNYRESNQDFTAAADQDGFVNFTWNYKTADTDGSTWDPFGYLLNGVFTKLTTDDLKSAQKGHFQFAVNAGDIFGFRMKSVDSGFGAAIAVVSNFETSPVPVPAAVWLIGAPLMGLLGKKRKVIA